MTPRSNWRWRSSMAGARAVTESPAYAGAPPPATFIYVGSLGCRKPRSDSERSVGRRNDALPNDGPAVDEQTQIAAQGRG